MATLDVSILNQPLRSGDFLYLEGTQIHVSQDVSYRGTSFNQVIEALNRSFDSESQLWQEKIQATYRGESLNLLKNLDTLQAKISRHNRSWCVWLSDWVQWFLCCVTGNYQSNQWTSLQLEKVQVSWCEAYEAKESGLFLHSGGVKESIQKVRTLFSAEMPDSYTHPSHLFMKKFREQVKQGVFKRVISLSPLIDKGRRLSHSSEDYERITEIIAHHIELAVYLTTMKEMRYNVGFCGDINRFLYAYLNFVHEWPLETGRPHIEMVNYEYPGLPPIIPGGNHAVLLVGRDHKTSLFDHSRWESAVQVMDAYEKTEELQNYGFSRRPDHGTLSDVLKLGAQPVRLVTNEPIDWSLIPEEVRPTFIHLYTDACIESQKAVRELLQH